MQGNIRKGSQKKRWEDNIKEWTEMEFASSTRAAEDRIRWKGIVAKSSVVPQRPRRVMVKTRLDYFLIHLFPNIYPKMLNDWGT